MPRRIAVRLRTLGCASLALFIVAVTAGPALAVTPLSYVALGDSYTAGPLVLPQDPNTPGCWRSLLNYPRLLNAHRQFSSFADVSCSGAKTDDMFASQAVGGGANPPQLDALTPTTGLVTLQVGGNDIGFSQIATNCVSLLPLGTPCRLIYASPDGPDEISRRIDATRPKVDRVIAAIKERSPEARIYLIGYPALFPEHGLGCWPFMPYAPGDVAYLMAKEAELNSMLAEQAVASGVTFVDTYTPSAGHDACTLPGFRWIEPVLVPLMGFVVHPNVIGMAGMQNAVGAAIGPEG